MKIHQDKYTNLKLFTWFFHPRLVPHCTMQSTAWHWPGLGERDLSPVSHSPVFPGSSKLHPATAEQSIHQSSGTITCSDMKEKRLCPYLTFYYLFYFSTCSNFWVTLLPFSVPEVDDGHTVWRKLVVLQAMPHKLTNYLLLQNICIKMAPSLTLF